MPRIDTKGNMIGRGEDAAFEMLLNMTGLHQRDVKMDWPGVGIYRQVPITKILSQDQLKDLSEIHKKSSVDIFMIHCHDAYAKSNECMIAVRVENKKGDLKMLRQGVQKRLLEDHCKVVDLHERECKILFKDKINPDSLNEIIESFKTANVEIPNWRPA